MGKCTHIGSIHQVLHVYLHEPWKDREDGLWLSLSTLKCKCSSCSEVFLKHRYWLMVTEQAMHTLSSSNHF